MASVEVSTSPVDDPDALVPMLLHVKAGIALEAQVQVTALLHRLSAPKNASGDAGEVYVPPFSATDGPSDAWDLPPWSPADRPAAKWILGQVTEGHRRILASILSAGSAGVWTSELRAEGGYEEGTRMSGPFKAIGGRFRRTGLRPVWNGGPKEQLRGQRLHAGDPTATALFVDVLKAEFPSLAEDFHM